MWENTDQEIPNKKIFHGGKIKQFFLHICHTHEYEGNLEI